MREGLTRQHFVCGAAAFSVGIGLARIPPGRAASIGVSQRGPQVYEIVIPDAATTLEIDASETLQRHLASVLGKSPAITRESARSVRRALVIGDTGLARQSYADIERLDADGFAVLPVKNDLVIIGGRGLGVLNGVYCLLEAWGFRRYASDAYHRPRVPDRGFPNRRIVFDPKIAYRTMLYADTERAEYAAWHRLSPSGRWGMFVHTFNELIPPEKYGAANPEFFSEIDGRRVPGTQLCLSNDAMRALLVANLSDRMAAKPDATHWSVSQNDNDQNCRCANCEEMDERYGGVPSGSILHFTNSVAKVFPDKTISTLAYWYSRTPPRNILAEPNVNIMLCNIESRRHAPVYETDPAFSRDMAGWGAIAGSVLVWDYEIQFTNLVSPFPNLHTIKPNIDFFVRSGVDALFMQANRDVGGEFAELRAYLIAKLMWNPDADDEAIIDDFLAGYYGAAAPFIRRYIDTMRKWLRSSGHKLDIFGSPEGAKDTYLTAIAMRDYVRLFDRAERAVADRPDLLERVLRARLPIIYAQIQIARNEPVDAPRGLYVRTADGSIAARPELKALVDRFADRCEAAGVTRLRERSTAPSDYRASYHRVFTKLAMMTDARSRGKRVTSSAPTKLEPADLARLTDGRIGSWESWSSLDPAWVSIVGEHFDVVIDLGAVGPVRSIEIGFLNAQAQPDYNTLKLPDHVTFSTSLDGAEFTPAVRIDNPHDPDPRANPGIANIPMQNFRHEPAVPTTARYVKVHANSMLRMPGWHITPGKPMVMATDQIIVT